MTENEHVLQKIAVLRAREKFPLYVMLVCVVVILAAFIPWGLSLALGGRLEGLSEHAKALRLSG